MTALYNEIDKNAAAWLRQLIIAGHIAPGVVDERDIRDLEPDYVATFTQFHAFAGIGVWSHALRRGGWSDDRPVWTGSCPCQPFSAAGKGGGFDDERHLWPAFHHLIAQCRPDVVLGEQVASKDGLNWLDLVHADLEGEGYAVGAADTCAAGFGAPHIRQRLYWSALADADHAGLEGRLAERQRAGQRTAGSGGLAGGMADANGGGPGAEREQCGWQQRQQPQDGVAGSMADATGGGWREECSDAGRCVEGDREKGLAAGSVDGSCDYLRLDRSDTDPAHPVATPEPAADGPDRLDDDHGDRTGCEIRSLSIGQQGPDGSQLRPGPTNGFWGAPDWLHCRDGRWRPVEPGTFPLVDGLAQRVVRGRDSSEPVDAQRSAEARVMRLRGYGNAIVASNATAFIESVMEAVA